MVGFKNKNSAILRSVFKPNFKKQKLNKTLGNIPATRHNCCSTHRESYWIRLGLLHVFNSANILDSMCAEFICLISVQTNSTFNRSCNQFYDRFDFLFWFVPHYRFIARYMAVNVWKMTTLAKSRLLVCFLSLPYLCMYINVYWNV